MKFEIFFPLSLRSFLKLTIVAVVLYGTYSFLSEWDLGETVNPRRIVEYLDAWGPVGPIVFIVMMATAVVISPIPSLPLDLAAGVAFGPFLGTVYAVIGAEIGAMISFLIGRFLGRDVIAKILKVDVVFCEKCTDRHLIGLVFLSRLFPVFSFDLISYGAGLTNMSLKAFALATLFGMIPPTYALTYFGSSVVTVDWPLILSGVGLIIVFLFLPKWIMKNPSTRWVRVLQGNRPKIEEQVKEETIVIEQAPSRCSWCAAGFRGE
ncbi:MAG: TVP38/TMEM64 family protein [Nitrospirota bacterium]|nr:MAG: TVP38/TMEM64 family protein [Nitrospirota bacterium]